MNPFKKPPVKWEQKRGRKYGKSYIAESCQSKRTAKVDEVRAQQYGHWTQICEPFVKEYVRRVQEDTFAKHGIGAFVSFTEEGIEINLGFGFSADDFRYKGRFARMMRKNARRYLAGLSLEDIQRNWDARRITRATCRTAAAPRAVRL